MLCEDSFVIDLHLVISRLEQLVTLAPDSDLECDTCSYDTLNPWPNTVCLRTFHV